MDIDDLVCFQAVARELSFTRAARALHLSQPAVSKRVRKLEDAVGAVLLRRSTSAVVLTPAGSTLLSEAERLIGLWRGVSARVRATGGTAAATRVRLAAFELFDGRLPSELCEALPHAQVTVTAAQPACALGLLANGDVDAALVYRPPGVSDLPDLDGAHVRTVVCEPQWMVLGRAHELADREHLTVQDVHAIGTPWHVSPHHHPISAWERAFLLGRCPSARLVEATDSSLRRIATGHAAALASPQNQPNETLVLLPLLPTATWQHQLVWFPERLPAAAELFDALVGFHQRQAQRHPRYWSWMGEQPDRFPGVFPTSAGVERSSLPDSARATAGAQAPTR